MKKQTMRLSLSLYVCRQKRIAEMQAAQMKARFGSLQEITAQDYVEQVNKAGDGVWVVLHLYKSGYPLPLSDCLLLEVNAILILHCAFSCIWLACRINCICICFSVKSLTLSSIPLCALINQHLSKLAAKFPSTKILRSISTTCIPNYPDKNLPTIFIYCEGEMKGQLVGPFAFGGMNLTVEGEGLERALWFG